jgi:hypothetical protein
MYYTLDEFIDRLSDLRDLTSGNIPVCVLDTDHEAGGSWYPASVEIQNAAKERSDLWDLPISDGEETSKIISIF